MHLGLFFVFKNKSKLFSRNQNDQKKLYFYRNKLIVSKYLTQFTQVLPNLCGLASLVNQGSQVRFPGFPSLLDDTLSCGLSSETL